MPEDLEIKVYEYVKAQNRPVHVPDIKRALGITERNVVEQAVLKNMRVKRMELTSRGVQVRA